MSPTPFLVTLLLAACGTLGETSAASNTASAARAAATPPAPAVESASTNAPPPVGASTPFAQPPVLIERDSAGPVPTDLPGPGYHCHWVAPGKRYCHSSFD
jgi:hypothetical protein